jgi:ferritin-like metal-binding protein YciE
MPAQMQRPDDLFLFDLAYMHAFEQQNVQTLQQLLQEVDSETAKRPLQHHLEETREQVQLLAQIFQTLGQQPQEVTVHAAQGLTQDHDAFASLRPAPAVLTLFDLGAAAKVEHLEVACYTGLLVKAQAMGQPEVAGILQRILEQEQDAVDEIEAAAKHLGQQAATA